MCKEKFAFRPVTLNIYEDISKFKLKLPVEREIYLFKKALTIFRSKSIASFSNGQFAQPFASAPL